MHKYSFSIPSVVLALGIALILTALAFSPKTDAATPGQDSFYPCESHNGEMTCFNRLVMRTASTTVCAVKSPVATSTLRSAGVRVLIASTTATVWDLARAATPFATTTPIGSPYNVGGGAMADIQASTSPAAGASTVFPPNTYFVVGVRNSITAGDASGLGSNTLGYCSATFDVI